MEDEAICRVCRSESTPDHPLFHPCKCSGSIRFVHQDCLIEWLSHSRKKYCELCEHPFTFTPIYRSDMPDRLPLGVFVKQCLRRLVQSLKFVLRALVVGVVWLVILPYSTLCTWRFYFWSGETIGFFTTSSKNVTLPEEPSSDVVPSSLLARLFNFMTFPVVFQWRTFLSDCFEGQLITAFVIVIFIAAYLFREWAMQNLLVEDEPQEDEEHLEQQHQAAGAVLDLARPLLERQGTPNGDTHNDNGQRNLIRENEQVDIDTLLHTLQNINNPNNDLENELQTRLAEMRRVLEQQRNSNDGNQQEQHSIGSGHSTPHNEHANEGAGPSWLQDHVSMDDQHHASSSQQSSNGKQKDTLKNNDDGDDDDGDISDSTYENQRHMNMFTRDTVISNWYDKHDSDEDIYRRRWRAPEFSEDDEEGDDEGNDEDFSHVFGNQRHLPPPYQPVDDPTAAAARDPAPAPAALVEEDVLDNNDDGGDDEMEPFDFGDDIDGVLEAIGMRGNPWMLLQNSVLMSLMVSLCLGVAVWIPYVVGRLVISIKPMSFIQTPISVMRLLTDPVVDFVLDRGIPLVWTWVTTKMETNDIVPESIQLAVDTVMTRLHQALDDLLLSSGNTAVLDNLASHKLQVATNNSSMIHQNAQLTDLQQVVESFGDSMLKRWQQFAIGQSGLDRTVCILVGYLVLVLIGSWYLGRTPSAVQRRQQQHRNGNNGGNMNMRRAAGQHGDTIQDILRQQGDFLKVVFFIVVELVIFPLACGVLLDGCTLPLFVDASMETRWAFYQTNPYSSCFLHWFFGTGFLFGVAVFVALCREVVRPGVIWFIRDPNDPQFHPIREMIERPTLPLLQKIIHSAMMYAGLIVAAVGSVVYTLNYLTNAFPLVVPLDTPFSTLSLDLLGVQFLLSPLISYLAPREYAKFLLDTWWRWTSRQLRLTSFMFDGRYPEEEGRHVRRSLEAWLLRRKAAIPSGDDDNHVYGDVAIAEADGSQEQQQHMASVFFQRDGQLLRVPKLDTVPVVPRRRMLVPVDPVTLEALDEEERRAGHPAASQSGDEDISTTIVYAPPQFKFRIILFIMLMWLSSSLLTCTLTVVPVCLGRYLFKTLVTTKAVHDVYNFATGAYVMVSMGLAIDWIVNKYQFWQENGATFAMVFEWTKSKLGLAGKVLYLAFTLGFVLPLMLGVTVDLYLFMPLRYSINDQPMVLHLSEDWTFGVAYASIIYGLIQVLPNNRWQQYLNQFTADGLFNISLWSVTRDFLAPVLLGTILAITIPGVLAWGCVQWLDDASRTLILVRWMYPIVFCTLLVGVVCYVSTKLAKLWVKSIRDDTYMIGKQLHNLDQGTSSTASSTL
ncbi:hypothetical protein BC941DRAFT_373111 [Chlamydoabsidia padenii]|nr:hypothetical protein BC941DRAFT_373111 [Chlamydoabsidia padenii]